MAVLAVLLFVAGIAAGYLMVHAAVAGASPPGPTPTAPAPPTPATPAGG